MGELIIVVRPIAGVGNVEGTPVRTYATQCDERGAEVDRAREEWREDQHDAHQWCYPVLWSVPFY